MTLNYKTPIGAALCLLGLLAGLIFLASPRQSFAALQTGPFSIETDTVWRKADNPHIVRNTITVTNRATLTIEPGVIVKFALGSDLLIYSNLIAEGRADDPIYFTSIHDDSIGGDTNGNGNATAPEGADGFVNLSGEESRASLSNLFVTYMGGILVDRGKITVRDMSMSKGDVGVMISRGTGDLRRVLFEDLNADIINVYRSVVDASDIVIKRVGFGNAVDIWDGTLTLRDSSIENVPWSNAVMVGGSTIAKTTLIADGLSIKNVTGIAPILLAGGTANITRGVFKGGSEGIVVHNNMGQESNLTLTDSSVEDYLTAGIYVFDSTVSIQNSVIRNNKYGISATSSRIVVGNSSIYDNTEYGFENYSTSSADARGNFWGDPSGPFEIARNPRGLGDTIRGRVDFVPWLTKEPLFTPPAYSSLVFIPGIQASRLYRKQTLENQLWEPNRNSDVEKLFFNSMGQSVNNDIYTRDIIDEVNILFPRPNIYKSFTAFLDKLVDEKQIAGWTALPYDWRFDLNAVVNGGNKRADDTVSFIENPAAGTLPYMISEIQKLAQNSGNGKVTIVAHSNGGLVAKALIRKLEDMKKGGQSDLVDKIDKVILVAVPQLGTPKAIPVLLHGYDQSFLGGFVLKTSVARQFAENVPGAYNLLPSKEYFKVVKDPVIQFDASLDKINNMRLYGNTISNASDLRSFLLGEKDHRVKPGASDVINPNVLNSRLLDIAEQNHDGFDTWKFPDHIKVVQIAGWGKDTLKGFEYKTKTECALSAGLCKDELNMRPLFTVDGDGTVVVPSAIASDYEKYFLDLEANNRGFSTNRAHKDILEVSSVMSLIENFIKGENKDIAYIYNNKPASKDTSRLLKVSVHSPVSIDVYDPQGNHTGRKVNANSDSDIEVIEENIPNSYYVEFGEDKYTGFDASENMRVSLQGTGTGTFTLETQETIGNTVVKEEIFKDIPVSPLMKGEVVLGNERKIKIDVDGNGSHDATLSPGTDFYPELFLESIHVIVKQVRLPLPVERALLQKINSVMMSVKKDKKREFLRQLQATFLKLELRKKPDGTYDKSDQAQFIKIVNGLLYNLTRKLPL